MNTVFQHYALFPHMTVAENVAYGLRQRREDRRTVRRKVGEALEMVKMTPLAKRKPRQLSGGQQQRVALARALVNRPSVLLLDEPLGALDRKLRQEMQIELKLLQGEVGITFVFVTHDQEEALSMSDRIAVMLDGHIEQLADPDTVYDQPSSAFVAGFIGQNNFFPGIANDDGTGLDSDGCAILAGRSAAGVVGGAGGSPPCGRRRSTSSPRIGPGVNRVGRPGRHVPPRRRHPVRRARPATATAEPATPPPRAEAEPGQHVWCKWDESHVHLFSDTQAASCSPTRPRRRRRPERR